MKILPITLHNRRPIMYQLPQAIWNQLAHEQPIRTQWARKMFNLTEQEIDQALEEEANKLSQKNYSNKAILAYQTMLPLLLENEAIRKFQQTEDNPELMEMLPEIYSVEEALRLATAEYRLMDNERRELQQLLRRAHQDRKRVVE